MNDDAADHRLIMDWLLVWVDGAGCGRHTSADPTRFIHRLAEVSYHVFDVICAERITDPVLVEQLEALYRDITEALIASMPDRMVTLFQDKHADGMTQLAILSATYLWMLSATDSLTLPHRPNLGSWRYRLAVTQDAATLLAHASI
jgi:hypothetical protein